MKNIIVLSAAAALLGCATSSTQPTDAVAVPMARARTAFGHENFAFVSIPADTGPINEGLVSGISAIAGPSHLIRDTAKGIEETKRRGHDLAIAGKSPRKTVHVAAESFRLIAPGSLAGMSVYIDAPQDADLDSAIRTTGAVPIFAKQ